MKVSVSQTINCAHQLPGTEVHGHTYRVTVTHSCEVASDGKAIDISDLAAILRGALMDIDHRRLETVIGAPATAERLALFIEEKFPIPCTVRIQIGDDGWVETE